MINLAYRDISNGLGRYLLTGLGLGLLIGVTLTMAGVYRGMVDDAHALIDASGADIWVVQQHTLGPYAEPSTLHDDAWRAIAGLPGVAETGNVTYLTMQVRHAHADVRVMIAGYEPGRLGEPRYLVAGRPVQRSHYEAVADVKTGFQSGDVIRIRRHDYTVAGLTKRMVSSGGDP
ncbi:MAG: ABC transporter permease, partial [Sulfuricella sp.]|nr:ABC transporter permease [Sulfuricella sp.]